MEPILIIIIIILGGYLLSNYIAQNEENILFEKCSKTLTENFGYRLPSISEYSTEDRIVIVVFILILIWAVYRYIPCMLARGRQ